MQALFLNIANGLAMSAATLPDIAGRPPLRLSAMFWAMYAAAPRPCACRHDGTGWKPATHAASMHALSWRIAE